MRINDQQLAILLRKEQDLEQLRAMLRHIFSFKENIDTFASFFFPHVLTDPSPPFHLEIYDELFKDSNSALAAPRGFAKSTIVGLVFLSFQIVNRLDRYIVYLSENHKKTVQFLEPIREEFKTNTNLRFVYGDMVPTKAKDDNGRDREDCFDIRCPEGTLRIEAVSFEKNLRGFKYRNSRPTLIVADDIENDERVMNPTLRQKDATKLNKVVIPALDVNGRFKFIGTILHLESLLMQKIKLYNGKIFKACDSDFKNTLWPERYNEEKLRGIRKDIGSLAFQQEYLNDPSDAVASIIKPEWIRGCFRPDLAAEDCVRLDFEYTAGGVDFAFSDAVSADESAFVTLGYAFKHYYLLHGQKEKGMSLLEQMRILKEQLHERFNYDGIGLEENSIKAMSKDIASFNLPITLFWTAASDPAAKAPHLAHKNFLDKRYTIGKLNLLLRVGTAFENKRFVIPYKTEADKLTADRILSECTSYALVDGKLVEAGIHPDYPLAIGFAIELINKMSRIELDFGD